MSDLANDKCVLLLRSILSEVVGSEELGSIGATVGRSEPTTPSDAHSLVRARATLEAVFLVAAADGKFLRSEVEKLHNVVVKLFERSFSSEQIDELLNAFADELDRDDYEVRIERVAVMLGDEWSKRAAFVVAVGVAYADGSLQDEEQDVITMLARGFALKQDVVDRVLKTARASMDRT